MNVNQLFVGMHYIQNKLTRRKQNLFLNVGYFLFFSKVQHLLESMVAVNFYVRFKGPAWVFRKKVENINVCTFWSFLQIFRSDSKFSQSGRLEIQISKNKYARLIVTDNTRLENVPHFHELVKIKKKQQHYFLFLWMGSNCFKATEPV